MQMLFQKQDNADGSGSALHLARQEMAQCMQIDSSRYFLDKGRARNLLLPLRPSLYFTDKGRARNLPLRGVPIGPIVLRPHPIPRALRFTLATPAAAAGLGTGPLGPRSSGTEAGLSLSPPFWDMSVLAVIERPVRAAVPLASPVPAARSVVSVVRPLTWL